MIRSKSSGRSMPELQKIWRKYSQIGSAPGSCAAILRTRGVTVNTTSTISSRVGLYPAAQSAHSYSSRRTVLSVALASSTPPQPGQSTFQDRSNSPIRDACRNAAMARSSSRPLLAAKSGTLTRHSAWSGASRTSRSIAATASASADCRRTLNMASVSLMPKRYAKIGGGTARFRRSGTSEARRPRAVQPRFGAQSILRRPASAESQICPCRSWP